MRPVVVTYATDDWYAQRAAKLKASCDSKKLDCIVARVHDRGSWVENCGHKPSFCLGMWWAMRPRPIIWIDADGTVEQEPTDLLTTKMAFGVSTVGGAKTRRQTGRTERVRLPPEWPKAKGNVWFNSGTLYFGRGASGLLIQWVREQQKNPRWFDQWTLQYAWAKTQPPTIWLDTSYCRTKLHRKVPAVIKHEFASELRKVDRR